MTTMFLTLFAMWMAGGLLGFFGGIAYGYAVGVKETEVRWSEAVGRAEDARLNG